ncbi:hypothetical protein NP233_g4966 [Leucocoprinus birnbaumii]|uniref:N-acetyltransferase domain-containing protein n=1 Tax=Leucocoprinus birnbaumii TaxID=56174 RepID=A0AAD5VV45_9AGAR|nr:hypothetical protein NP233_g4966 [Leucocoprinus birnbaumii]
MTSPNAAPGGHDFNFCFPVPSKLENERVKLIPFEPIPKYTEAFVKASKSYPDAFKYLGAVGPYETSGEFLTTFYYPIMQDQPGFMLFLLLDKTKPASTTIGVEGEEGALAGHLAYINSSAFNLATEIGYILVLPPFQRTHVTSNAIGLMMHFALDLPDRGGLGLRRVFWQCNELNEQSKRTAERMGFRYEGILRWDRVLPPHKKVFGVDVDVREGDPRGKDWGGRHTAIFGHCWDDWENGGREKIDAIMARVV